MLYFGIFLIILGLTIYIFLMAKRNKVIKKFKEETGTHYFEKNRIDYSVKVNSARAVHSYDIEKLFKNEVYLNDVLVKINKKKEYNDDIINFIKDDSCSDMFMYKSAVKYLTKRLISETYNVKIWYISPAGRSSASTTLFISKEDALNTNYAKKQEKLAEKVALKEIKFEEQRKREELKTQREQLKYDIQVQKLKDQQAKAEEKEKLDSKKEILVKKVDIIIANIQRTKNKIIFNDDIDKLDDLIYQLKDISLNDVDKIKEYNVDKFNIIEMAILDISKKILPIVQRNERLYKYYNSEDFINLKKSFEALIQSKKEFNEYIDEKVESISSYFGVANEREETSFNDSYNYNRKYKKDLSLFTAEVSANVFASAENSPIEYVIKYFFDDKEKYPEQIQKLQFLIEELETLKDAKQIIDNYKKEYQEYFTNVPSFVFEEDSDGFYTRLGFADISEKSLTFNYKFSYTSNGNKAQKSFLVPMTEENIIKLIEKLQDKLTYTSFAKEQRTLMTSNLRQRIKERDNYTCRYCENSTHKEPNLLLEIDHIIPIKKGGLTKEENLQTLCWKCNRTKGSKIKER